MKIFLLILLFFYSISLKAQAPPKILFQDNFESFNLNNWSNRFLAGSWSMVQSGVDSGFGGVGTYANRVTLYYPDLVFNNHMALLVYNNGASAAQTNTGVRWSKMSFKLPTGWVHDVNHTESLMSFHDGEPCANVGQFPQFAFLQSNGAGTQTNLRYEIDYDSVAYCSGGSSLIQSQSFSIKTNVTLNQWHTIIVQSNWDWNTSGFVNVWFDDTLRLAYTGRCWYNGVYTEPSIRFGDFKYSWNGGQTSSTTQRILLIDDIKIGSYTADSTDFKGANQKPIANAGGNKNIQLPTHEVTLSGTGSTDVDGNITNYLWTRISGPNTPAMPTPTSAITTLGHHVSGADTLIQGTYVYQLKVTDNGGAVDSQQITIIVNAAANFSPIANAGPDGNTQQTQWVLDGHLSNDPDGTISTYAWTQVRGPNTATIANPANSITNATGLIPGFYTFKLTVTDNSAATGTDTINLVINPVANIPPLAITPNQFNINNRITLPNTKGNLDGSRSNDPDGFIATFTWTQQSGPNTATLSHADSSIAVASGLILGKYIFRLTVTDDKGATNFADYPLFVIAVTRKTGAKAR